VDNIQIASIEQLSEIIRNTVSEKIKHEYELSDVELRDRISNEILGNPYTIHLSTKVQFSISLRVFDSLRRYDVIQKYMDDHTVTEIMINSYDEIFVERFGNILRTGEMFDSANRYEDFIHSILSKYNKSVNELSPIADLRIEQGARMNVVLPPIATKGPAVTIRKFSAQPISLDEYVNNNCFPKEILGYLRWAVETQKNIFISGGTGSGKTSLLNALLSFVPKEERIVVIEDTRELNFDTNRNIVYLETRQVSHSNLGEITMSDLIRTSLRMRPSRIIVGEVRGGEVIDMLNAMNTGHYGSMSTGHSNSPRDLFSRLESMALSKHAMPISLIRKLIANAIHIVIHLTRSGEGTRIVSEICEVECKDEVAEFITIYQFGKGRDEYAA
jgi:pilus assembly protein CpaF